MSELKPCPFCGSREERPINHAEDCFIRMYAENVDEYYYSETLVHDRESMMVAWNTRAERTCEMVHEPPEAPYHVGKWTCSACGAWWMKPPYDMSGANCCPNCGAKVVRS